jgi:hypothetical protein
MQWTEEGIIIIGGGCHGGAQPFAIQLPGPVPISDSANRKDRVCRGCFHGETFPKGKSTKLI